MKAARDPRAVLGSDRGNDRTFEPRLKNVNVELLDKSDPIDRVLRFRIDALLHVEPISDNVSFDSAFEPVQGRL